MTKKSCHLNHTTHPPLSQADTFNNGIRRLDLVTGLVLTLAGSPTRAAGNADGLGTSATFNSPQGIAVDAAWTVAVIVR